MAGEGKENGEHMNIEAEEEQRNQEQDEGQRDEI